MVDNNLMFCYTIKIQVPQQDDDKKCGFFVMYCMTLFLWMCPNKFSSASRLPDFVSNTDTQINSLMHLLIYDFVLLNIYILWKLKEDWFSIQELDSFRGSLLAILGIIGTNI